MAIDYSKRPSKAASAPVSAATPSGPGAPVTLSKITLTKSSPAVSLNKRDNASGLLRINLNWNVRPAPSQGSFFSRLAGAGSGGAIDLDLACLYEFTDGSKGVVQALGKTFQSRCDFTREPVIRLDGDDRSGTNSAGENLFIDLAYSDRIQRILVFAFIYEGIPNWAQADGVVTIFPVKGPQIEVRLDEADPRSRMCAVALVTGGGGDLQIRREVRYVHGGQRNLDEAYGWGLRWQAGRK